MEIDVHDVIRIARRRGWIVLLVAIVAGAGALAAAFLQEEQFAATATFMVMPADDTEDNEDALEASGRLIPTYQELATSGTIIDRVIDSLDLDESPKELRKRVSSSVVLNTYLVEVTVTDSDPERAARISSAFVEEFEEYAERPSASDGDGEALAAPVRVTDPAPVPTEAFEPRPLFWMVLGTFGGFLLGLAVIVVLQVRDGVRRAEHRVSDAAASQHARS